MERQTLWRANVATATRTMDGRKQSYRRMGSSESTSGRNVYKQSFVFQYPASSLTHPSRPTSSLSQRTRPSPKAGKLPTRAHSSLGFAWSSQSVSKHKLSQPQGFDLAGYVKKQGSATEIRIGVNGETTNDDYFRNYLKECEKQLENASPLSLDDDSTSTFKGDISEGISISQNTRKSQKHVPLCWKDQFQKAEPNMIKTAGKTTTRKSSSPTYAKAPQSPTSNSGDEPVSCFTQNLQDLSVMLSLGEMCVLNWTAVKLINTVTVPQTTHSEDNSQVNHGFEATVSDPYTDTSTLPLQFVDADHHGCSDTISKEVQLSSLLDSKEKELNTSNSNLLCIWLKPSTGGTSLAADMIYKGLTFDVFVTVTGSSTVAFTEVKCRDTSGGMSAIVVNLDGRFVQRDQFVRQLPPCTGHEVKISVTCHKPRRMIFSTKVLLPVKHIHTSSALPLIPSEPGIPLGDKATVFPEKFFKRRSSYCDQEEDEDRTDIRALVSHYPDLQVLDLDNPTPPPLLLHHELRPSSHHTPEFNNPATPPPLLLYHELIPSSHHTRRTAVAEARPTIQLSPPPISTPSPASTSRSLFRPHSKPHPTPGYVAIVKHWLRPFTADSN